MPSADLDAPCLVALLQGDAGAAALRATLVGLLERTDPTVRIEVFGFDDEAHKRDGLPDRSDRSDPRVPAADGDARHPPDPLHLTARVHWRAPVDSAAHAARALADVLPGADLAVLAAGTVLPERWRQRLQRALRADPSHGTASPLRDADPLYAPGPPPRGRAWPAGGLDRWLEGRFGSAALQMTRPPAATVLVRADARAALAGSAEADWGRELSAAGWAHVATPGMFVGGARRAHVAPSPTTLLAAPEASPSGHPLAAVRATLASLGAHELDSIAVQPATEAPMPAAGRPATRTSPPPVQLHVAHSWGGGLGRWIEDFCDADAAHRNLVLRSVGVRGAYGQRLCLQRGYADTEPLRVWDLSQPIHATAQRHMQYRAILREVIEDFDVRSVLVSSLIGHSLDVLATGLPTAVVTHDYYPMCVAIFGVFETVCTSCDRQRLGGCIAGNPLHEYFKGVDAGEFDALRAAFVRTVLERDIRLIAPSRSAALQWRALAPALERADFAVVPHGVALPEPAPFEPPAGGRLRLVVLNRLAPEKGGRLFAEMLPELARFADITLLGCSDTGAAFAGTKGIRVVPQYTRSELPALVAAAKPHLGLQLSVFAETYCYALTELWQMGVPVLACRIGSLAERITEGVDGFLAEPRPDALLARLREIDLRRDDLAAMRASLLERPVRRAGEMVADYQRLLPTDPWYAAAAKPDDAPPADTGLLEGRVRVGPIAVSAQATYATALGAFARYTLSKIRHSPRLPRVLRRVVELLPRRWWEDDGRV